MPTFDRLLIGAAGWQRRFVHDRITGAANVVATCTGHDRSHPQTHHRRTRCEFYRDETRPNQEYGTRHSTSPFARACGAAAARTVQAPQTAPSEDRRRGVVMGAATIPIVFALRPSRILAASDDGVPFDAAFVRQLARDLAQKPY